VAAQIVKLMIKKGISVNNASLLMLGITFKENCPDVRNTKIVDVIAALTDYGISVTIYDPLASPEAVKKEYRLVTSNTVPNQKFDAVVLAVAHAEFLDMDLSRLQNKTSLLYDVKGVLGDNVDGRL
jgi:UDP-N-acetyl-D-galactosamine dehydrogenase